MCIAEAFEPSRFNRFRSPLSVSHEQCNAGCLREIGHETCISITLYEGFFVAFPVATTKDRLGDLKKILPNPLQYAFASPDGDPPATPCMS